VQLAEAWHVKHLVDRAHALGADRAAPLPAASVVVDERVRLKCRVPRCSSYGRNLMCPPHVPGPEETRAALARYADVLIVQRDIAVTQVQVDAALDGKTYAESRALGAEDVGCDNEITAAQNAFAKLMSALEREAFRLGYRFAAAYAGGDCVLCEVCEGIEDGVCRHPFEARPSAEAVGVDVIATARAAGLDIEMPAVDRASWTGMLLID
jgi:predicted metal-binding protein